MSHPRPRGPERKPAGCTVYPYRFVRTPDGVSVGVSWSCPAVVDANGPTLADQSAQIDTAWALASARGYVTEVGATVQLTPSRAVHYASARGLIDALCTALDSPGNFVSRVHAMAGVAVGYDESLGSGAREDEALSMAVARGPVLAAEALGAPMAIDRLSRALFKGLLFLAQGEPALGVWAGLSETFQSLLGRGTLRLRDGTLTRASSVAGVSTGLPVEGEVLLTRWLRAELGSMAFFGKGRARLTLYQGLEFLILSAAVAVYLSRAHAAAKHNTQVALPDVRAAVLQLESRLVNRTDLPPRFGLALTHTATLDLLRAQLSP